ncbi:hypothetical protein L596_025054 [Steinernema carpocapsae]|uniref:Fatty-acid and retinol-binding protein 1 n=1 Tax=Steinernema carpocapsae TaxID=34508 RepID=A0A4U5M6N2_STECR|nr:hypothetical protein L596_025054 [Steinernema carpocapsae]
MDSCRTWLLVVGVCLVVIGSGKAKLPPKLLNPFVPTITLQFLSILSPEESKALDTAKEIFAQRTAQGDSLSVEDYNDLVKNQSVSAYSKLLGFQEAITRLCLTLPKSVQIAVDEIIEDKTSLDYSRYEELQELKSYAIKIAEAFKRLRKEDLQTLIKAFPNYGFLVKDAEFQKITDATVDESHQAEVFVLQLAERSKSVRSFPLVNTGTISSIKKKKLFCRS